MGMFYEKPIVRVSRRVAACMYGNGVSVSDAEKFYKACQQRGGTSQRPIRMDGICSGLSVVLVRYSSKI